MNLLDKVIHNAYFKRIMQSDVNSKLAGNAFWLLIGTVFSKILLLVTGIIIARLLGKTEVGQFGIIRSTIDMFTAFAGLGLGLTVTKYISELKRTDKNKTGRIIGLSNEFALLFAFLFSTLIYFFSDVIAMHIKAPALSFEIKLSSFVLFFNCINGVQAGILAGFEQFKIISKNAVIAAFFSSIFQIIGVIYWGLEGVILGYGLNFLILYFLNYWKIKKVIKQFEIPVKIFNKENRKELDVLWKFSIPAVLAGLMVSPVIWICNNFLVNQNNGYLEMANIDIGNQWRGLVLFIPTALSQIALPMLSSNVDNKEIFREVFRKNIKLSILISSTIVLIVCLFSPIIVKTYGNEYKSALIPLIIMMITTGLIAVNNIIGQGLASKGKMWLGFQLNLVWAFFIIVLSYIFIVYQGLGAIGLSLAYLLSYLIHTIIQYFFAKN